MVCFAPRQEAGENGFGERELVTKAATRKDASLVWKKKKKKKTRIVSLPKVSQTGRLLFTEPDIVRGIACNE